MESLVARPILRGALRGRNRSDVGGGECVLTLDGGHNPIGKFVEGDKVMSRVWQSWLELAAEGKPIKPEQT